MGGDNDWNALIPTSELINSIHEVYFILGFTMLTFGMVSLYFKHKIFISEAFGACILGIVFGPVGAKLFNPKSQFGEYNDIFILEFSRLVIGLQCLNVGIELPTKYWLKNKLDLMIMLGPIMIFMWTVSSLGVYYILGTSITNALIIGACVTPTDPVLVSVILSGRFADKYVSKELRDLLSAESALNDGLGLCFMLIPFYISRINPVQDAILWFLVKVLLYQIILASLLGFLLGYLLLKTIRFSTKRGLIEHSNMLAITFAILLFTVGAMSRLGIDDILGCVFVGFGLSYDGWFVNQVKGHHINEVLDIYLNTIYFFIVGGLFPWAKFGVIGIGKLLGFSLFILMLRRMPIVTLLYKYVPTLKNARDVFFCGWFGPVGGGAIFYAMIAMELKAENSQDILAIVLFTVLCSIIIHGGSVVIMHKILKRTDGSKDISGSSLTLPLQPQIYIVGDGS